MIRVGPIYLHKCGIRNVECGINLAEREDSAFRVPHFQSRLKVCNTFPSGSTTSTIIGIWPMACVEQLRHGSCARTAASTRLSIPSCTGWPGLMYVLATLSTASVIAQLL